MKYSVKEIYIRFKARDITQVVQQYLFDSLVVIYGLDMKRTGVELPAIGATLILLVRMASMVGNFQQKK